MDVVPLVKGCVDIEDGFAGLMGGDCWFINVNFSYIEIIIRWRRAIVVPFASVIFVYWDFPFFSKVIYFFMSAKI